MYGIDGQRVLRRYRDGRDVSTEAEVMRHVRRFGYPVPQLDATGPGEMVLQHLHGPTMLEALERATVTAADAGQELVRLLARLHTVPARAAAPSAQLHLDLHPGNVALTAAGPVVIDWCNARDGPPGLDVGMTAVILAQVAVDSDPRAAVAHAVLDALLRCTAVDPDQLDTVLARRRADPNLTTAEQALLPTAARLISARKERSRGGSTDSSTR